MTPEIFIRPRIDTDWSALCRIHDLARVLEIGSVCPRDAILSMEQAAVEDRFFDDQTFVACTGSPQGPVAGFISIRVPEITWLYVDPALHRRGIGRKLMQHVLPLLGPDAFLLVITENPKGIAFYSTFGFIPAARFPGDAHGHPCECVRMTLPTSIHRHRPPTPTRKSLQLAGFTEKDPGTAVLDEEGVFVWRKIHPP